MKTSKSRASCMIASAIAALMIPMQASSETLTYKYDSLGRVIAACYGTQAKHMAFSYDGAGNRTSVVVAAACLNVPPVAYDDAGGGPQQVDTTVIVYVLSNDVDTDGDALSVTAASCASSGCSVTFPGGAFIQVLGTSTGTKTVDYTVSDGKGGTDAAQATVHFIDDGGCPLC